MTLKPSVTWLLVPVLIASCSAEKSKEGQDVTPGPAGSGSAAVGLSVTPPSLKSGPAVYDGFDLKNLGNECLNEPLGTAFLYVLDSNQSPTHWGGINFCYNSTNLVTSFGPGNDMDLMITDAYAVLVARTLNQITDYAVITVAETATQILGHCSSTSLAGNDLPSVWFKATKSNPDEMQSLVSGSGVCAGVTLVDKNDLTTVNVQDSVVGPSTIKLTKVYP